MGKGGGGGVDTSGLEQATLRSIALQEDIYNQTREDVQPWYQLGVGATNRLSDLLGVSGGSVRSREDIYSELSPQYTTQQSGGAGNLYTRADGSVFDITQNASLPERQANNVGFRNGQNAAYAKARESGDFGDYAEQYGFTAVNPVTSTIDYNALNAAVEERLAAQSETPEGFGSLLERFDIDKFEADPGYQFRQEEANRALERQLAAQGVTLGGAGYGDINPSAIRASQELNQNLASQEYGNSYNRYVQDNLNIFNMLMGASGLGQGSTGILATGGQNYATNVGNLQTGLASAQLNASLQNQSSGGSMFGSLLGGAAGAFFGNPALGAAAGNAIFG